MSIIFSQCHKAEKNNLNIIFSMFSTFRQYLLTVLSSVYGNQFARNFYKMPVLYPHQTTKHLLTLVWYFLSQQTSLSPPAPRRNSKSKKLLLNQFWNGYLLLHIFEKQFAKLTRSSQRLIIRPERNKNFNIIFKTIFLAHNFAQILSSD